MTDPVSRKCRIPHWTWWIAATGLIVAVFLGLRFGISLFQQKQILADLREMGFKVETAATKFPSNWLRMVIGEDWVEAFCTVQEVDNFGNDLTSHEFSPRTWQWLSEQASLEVLGIDSTPLTDVELGRFRGLTLLTALDIGNTRITDAGLANLKPMVKLDFLLIPMTQITSAGLEHLKVLNRLETLDLRFTHVSDSGLIHLEALPNLRFVYLDGTDVTATGVAKLKVALPSCEIRGP